MMTPPKAQSSGRAHAYRGRILDERYRLDKVIGQGAIGKVYSGTQLAVDRKVAVKLLHPSIRDRELTTERFLREAKAVARLSHSSCLTLFDFGSCDELGCFYMVTEFVEGKTLAGRMQEEELPVGEVFHIFYQITAALEHAHDRGILHRDLKPENIMLVADELGYSSVKVLDFGLARIREEAAQQPEPKGEGSEPAGGSRLTNFGDLNGTPAFMSPEQCRGELDLTPACDYYALGVLAFEMFEGHLPYEASQVPTLLSMHLSDPIPKMKSGRAPEPVESMVYRLMAKDPELRLQSPDEIFEILRPYVAFEPSHELSRSSLERIKRETTAGQTPSPSSGVARSGDQTLIDYDNADTPLPIGLNMPIEDRETMYLSPTAGSKEQAGVSRDSAFGTFVGVPSGEEAGGAEEAEQADDGPASRRLAWAGAAVALFAALVVVGVWQLQAGSTDATAEAAGSSASATAEEHAEPDELAASPEGNEQAQAAEDDDEDDQETAEEDELTAAGEEAEEAADEPAADQARPAEQRRRQAPARSTKPRKGEEERRRPRKLELTY